MLKQASLAILLLGVVIALKLPATLSQLEEVIQAQFAVPELTARELHRRLHLEGSHAQTKKLLMLFDVREEAEYRVSHLKDAFNISPSMTAEAFFQRYGRQIKGKCLVFYCSVGYRSSEFAQRVLEMKDSWHLSCVMNLRGGLFRWYNEGYPVYNDQGETDAVHPYNSLWGMYLEKRK